MNTETLAQRLVVGLVGPALEPEESAWLERWRPAGVILFGRNVTGPRQLRMLCRAVHELLAAEAEVVADHEGGPISVLAAAIGRPPAPFALGVIDDADLTRRVHLDTARLARAAGVQRLLAPCADVLVRSENPVIGSRAFGAVPELVARHVSAAVHGLRQGGVGVCLKHWPGHGGSRGDSHTGPAQGSRGFIAATFQAGVRAGADALMVGHLQVQDPQQRATIPATLSAAEISRARSLSDQQPWNVFSDDVTMGALRPAMAALAVSLTDTKEGLIEPAELPSSWFEVLASAGCDRLLCRGIPWRAFPLPAHAGSTSSRPDRSADGATAECVSQRPEVVSGQPESYREARRRLAEHGLGRHAPRRLKRALWLDATDGDRWGEAHRLRPLLEEHFREVVRRPLPLVAGPEGPFDLLLVTSHRPLGQQAVAAGLPPELWTPAGTGIVMGHPCLESTVRNHLPAGWRLVSLYDIQTADLAPLLERIGGRGRI